MAGDPNYASVSLLLHCDGTNGSTTFTDNSPAPKTATVNGNAQISTTQSKYGGASMKLDGSGDYISIPYSAALSLISGDWTIEAWVYVAAYTAGLMSIVNKDGVSGASYSQYDLAIKSTGEMAGFLGNGNGVSPTGTTYTGTTTVTTGVWHHVAMVKTGATCKGFLDGVQEWSAAAGPMYEGSKALLIGYQTGQPSSSYLNGYIDDLRITKGIALYTANFTPPAAAFPDGMGYVGGVVRDDTGALCARTVRLIRRDTGALLSSMVSDASTGAYRLATPTLDEVVRIVHSNTTTAPLENDLIDRVIPA